jgi:peptidoglycan/xylan/chitin deacetylase (PgdA/CDA1 family)
LARIGRVKEFPGQAVSTLHRVTMKRRAFLTAVPLLAAGACAAPVPGAATSIPATSPAAPTSAAPVPTGPASEFVHATSGRPEVALTFHGAGDLDLATKILTGFADRGAAVTVLAIGTWLQASPDAAKIVTGHGHELGNHTWSHPNLAGMSEAAVRAEIERCRDRLAALTGSPGAFFRPSAAQHATAVVRKLAGAAGYARVLSYDVDSRDFTDPGAAAIRRNVRAAVAGSVVSMHLGHPGTLDALPGIIDDLAASESMFAPAAA